MKYRLSKRRIIQVLLVIMIVVFGVRESRILWNVKGLEIFDLAHWGINISDEGYSAQNLFMCWGGVIVLILLRVRKPPKVSSEHAPEPSKVKEKPLRRRKREKAPEKSEESNPFEMVNSEWKPVFPKKDDEKTKGRKK